MKAAFPILLLSLFLYSCTGSSRIYRTKNPQSLFPENNIRVLLEDNLKESDIIFKNPVILRTDNQNIATLDAGDQIEIAPLNGGLQLTLGRRSSIIQNLDIYPSRPESFVSYKNSNYRGILRIRNSGKGLSIINVLPVEDYLKGVIYPEMGVASKPDEFEALKAFAICVRNYAYMKMRLNGAVFDVYPDSRDQHYKGMDSERLYCSRAVDETRGLMLMYNSQPAQVFYYSSCGGHTENSDNVFTLKGLEHMPGVKDGDDPYCSISPSFAWEENYSGDDIVNYLKSAGLISSKDIIISDIEVFSRFDSGRVNELKIETRDNKGREKEIILKGNPIRNVIRSKKTKGILKSTMFSISPDYRSGVLQKLTIKGRGNGHGAGLCQWGAIGQSRQGRSCREILDFYFPGTKVEKL